MKIDPALDEIGAWTEIKLRILRDYAREYAKILGANNFQFWYVDAFAGAGLHVSRRRKELVLGSPRIALEIEPRFTTLYFLEIRPDRIALLNDLKESDKRIQVIQGDCNDVLWKEVIPRLNAAPYARALVILDPYKLNYDWRIVEALGKSKKVDLFLNFMIMDANMNMWHRNPDSPRADQISRLDIAWGDHSWWDVGYDTRQGNLFGETDFLKTGNAALAQAYQRRLKEVAGFAHVPPPIPMKNSRGGTIYYLYFASQKPVAEKIVRYIFGKYRARGLE